MPVDGLFAEFQQRKTVDVKRFIIRRGFKIWPPYFVFLGFVALWLGWKAHGNVSAVWADLWPNLVHVQNYFHTPRIHTWSLAVEEHFYLAIAIIFFIALRGDRTDRFFKNFPRALMLVIASLAALRHVEYLFYGPENINLYATHLRFDGLVVGTLLAYWTYFEPEKITRLRRRPLVLLVIGATLAAPTLFYSPEASVWTFGIGLTGVYIGFGLILLGWINLEAAYPLARKVFSGHAAALLGQVGFYSYSIYLWHIDFGRTPIEKITSMANGHAPGSILWLGGTLIYVIAAVVMGSTLSRLFEIPSLAMRDRLFPKIKVPTTKNSPEDCFDEQLQQEVNIKTHLSGHPV